MLLIPNLYPHISVVKNIFLPYPSNLDNVTPLYIRYDSNLKFVISSFISCFFLYEIVLFHIIWYIPIIFIMADLISGIIHLYLDLTDRMYIISSNKKSLFYLHHEHPNLIIKVPDFYCFYRPFATLYLSFCILFLLRLVLSYSIVTNGFLYLVGLDSLRSFSDSQSVNQNIALQIMFLTLFYFCFFHISHKYSHVRTPSYFISLLQKCRIFIPFTDHHPHHKYYDRNFSIVNGVTNSFINFMIKKFIFEYNPLSINKEFFYQIKSEL